MSELFCTTAARFDTLDRLADEIGAFKVDEFYAWFDLKQDFRVIKREGHALLDALDDIGADLSEGLDTLLDFSDIETAADSDPSRSELTFHVWE